MNKADKIKKEQEQEAKQSEAKKQRSPQIKLFVFQKEANPVDIEKEVNTWYAKATLNGEAPMPGKAFCNHATGETNILFVHVKEID